MTTASFDHEVPRGERLAQAKSAAEIDVEIGIIVQSLCFRKRWRQADLGAILGIGQATVSKKLRGVVAFSGSDLVKIAAAAEVPVGLMLPELPANEKGRAYDVDPASWLPELDSNQQPSD